MSHFALLWKARTIEKYRKDYENEKINSIIMSDAEIPQKTLFQRWRHYSHGVQKRLSRTFSKWYPEGSTMSNILVHFRGEMRFPHILLRGLFGFVGGLVLTYLCFVFLVFQLSLSLIHATILSSLFGILITLGLTFSNSMRCLVFLLIPQLFSRAGRYTLTCYALVLILTGPATNTLKNSEVLSESMACSQERIKSSVENINGSVKKPINSIKDSIKVMVEQTKQITVKLKSALLKVNRLILNIASHIQSNLSWLGTVSEACNIQLGSPYKRCITLIQASMDDCEECFDRAHWYNAAASVARVACGVLKPYDKFCVASDFAGETFYATVRKKLKTFTKRISKIMFLKIHTHHSYTFIGNTSTSSEVAAGIVTEIRRRADPILTWLSWSSCVTSLFLLLIIFRAKHYQLMYLTRSRFDNRYITKEFRELDLKRMREGRDTVLPLNRRERTKYVTTTSFRLVASEKMYLNRSAVFMMITTFKLLIHIVADYSLYWVMITIQYHKALQSPLQPQLPATGVHITGQRFVSHLVQSLIDTLNIPLQLSAMTSKPCLPNPNPPDFKRYGQIVTLILLLWFFALFEPYGLRLRHQIMGHYKPERAKTRALWLYNHILRTRGSFMKFARRKLHREYKYASESKLTFRNWLRSIIPFQFLHWILGINLEEARCLLCGAVEDYSNSHTTLVRCEFTNCPGIYCASCFFDIGQMCTICLSPTDYGDLSDVSLEKGSDADDDSDDQNYANASDIDYADDKENSLTNVSPKLFENDNLNSHLTHQTDKKSKDSDCSHFIGNKKSASLHPCHGKIMQTSSINTTQQQDISIANVIKDLVINKYHENIFKLTQTFAMHIMCFFEYSRHIFLAILNPDLSGIPNTKKTIFYSFYRISFHDKSLFVTKYRDTFELAKLLRNRKNMRKRNRITVRKQQLGIHESYKGNTKLKASERHRKNNDTKSNRKMNENPSRNTSNVPEKHSKKETTADNKHRNHDVLSVCDKHSTPHISSIFCSKYWNSISKLLSCSCIPGITNDLPQMEEKKHKRKKKHKKTKHKLYDTNKHETKLKNDNTRQYRLYTFLADQYWRKTSITDVVHNEIAEITKNDKTNEIEVNNIKIPRLDLRFSSDSFDTLNTENTVYMLKELSEIDTRSVNKKEFTIQALGRFFRRISSSVLGIESTKRMQQASSLNQLYNSNSNIKNTIKETKANSNLVSKLKINSGRKSCTQKAVGKKHSVRINETLYEKMPMTDDELGDVNETKKSKHNEKKKSVKRVKGPLSIIKDFYTSIFTPSDTTIENYHVRVIEVKKESADKEISVQPVTVSCACQQSKSDRKDFCTQVEQIKLKRTQTLPAKEVCDAEVNAVYPTCTCATQYRLSKEVDNYKTLETQNPRCGCEAQDTESSKDSDSTIDSECSVLSEDTKTDTTVCSLAIVDFRNDITNKKTGRMKIKVVTKQNQSTLTDRADVCNVSTETDDWWSPIVEKREPPRVKKIAVEKGELPRLKGKIKKERITFKCKGIETDGKFVTFRSQAQIIPRDSPIDILSPSRYLLESQKYYNELFSSKLYAPRIFPVSHMLKHQKLEKAQSPLSHRHSRRSHRIKVLECRKGAHNNLQTW